MPGAGPINEYALDGELRHEGAHLEVVVAGGRPRRAGVVGELHLVRRRRGGTRRGGVAADVLLLLLEQP